MNLNETEYRIYEIFMMYTDYELQSKAEERAWKSLSKKVPNIVIKGTNISMKNKKPRFDMWTYRG